MSEQGKAVSFWSDEVDSLCGLTHLIITLYFNLDNINRFIYNGDYLEEVPVSLRETDGTGSEMSPLHYWGGLFS